MPTFTHSGIRIHYRQHESAQFPGGPNASSDLHAEHHSQKVMVILPGNTASSAHHSGELAFFHSLGYQAIALDYLGTGQSDRLPRPWPTNWFERNAATCTALLDHLSTERAVLCGTSGGAIVALWMAILFPDRVSAVIADSTCMRFLPSMFHTVEINRAQRSSGQAAFWFDGHGRDWQDVVDADTEMILNIKKDLACEGTWEVHQGRLSEIRCPVLFTCSLTDELIPEAGSQMLEMAAQVQNSQYFAANQGGHPLIWSCPQTFQSVVRGFLQVNDN